VCIVQMQQVDQFIHRINIAMRQRHECKQLSIIIDRIESYDAVDLPSDECLKVCVCIWSECICGSFLIKDVKPFCRGLIMNS